MRRFVARRPSPAMAVAFVALLAALSGTAVALPGKNKVDKNDIRKNAVRGKAIASNAVTGRKVRNNSLTGADVTGLTGADITNEGVTGDDVNESTLGKVPSATAADSASALTSLIVFGPTSLNEGQEATVFSHGPFSAIARCADDGGNTELNVILASTQDGGGFGGDDNNGPLGPATPETDRFIENPGATDPAGGDPLAHSDGYDDQFSMVLPGGPALNGTVSSTANGDAQTCTFYGHVQIVK
jgi:hypothetical protein